MKQIFTIAAIILFSFPVFAQPANNICVNAQGVIIPVSGSMCVQGTNTGATTSGEISNNNPGCKSVPLNEVWYSYVATGAHNMIKVKPIGPNPIQGVVLVVREGGCGTFTNNGCDTALSANDSVEVSIGLVPGTQLWIDVSAYIADGDFELCITSVDPPSAPGNTCEDATIITHKLDFTVSSLSGITSSGIAPTCFNNGAANQDIWYKFQVKTTGMLAWKATPNAQAEFDWALFDITDGCPDISGVDLAQKELACNFNFSEPGNSDPIGMRDSVFHNCPQDGVTNSAAEEFCRPMLVQTCRTYALMIENFSGTGSTVGFDFEWGGDFDILNATSDSCIVGIKEEDLPELSVFPNPSSGEFTIEVESGFSKEFDLKVYNGLGQLIWNKRYRNSLDQVNLDLSHLSGGIYYLKYKSGQLSASMPLLISD